MNPPSRVLTPELPAVADAKSRRQIDWLRGATNEQRATDVQTSMGAPPNVARLDKPERRVPIRGDAGVDLRSARPEVIVRFSVVDGADRLVYVDTRDRRGWKQPLAAEQVASELRRHRSATDGVSPAAPRTVRTLEVERPLVAQHRVDSMPASNTPTPYSHGKAGVSASALLAAQPQRMSTPSRTPALSVQATVQAPTRAR